MARFGLALLTACVLAFPTVAADKDKDATRVACLGDSITYGAGVKDREKNCYPAVLGRLLGDEYDVRNFGVSGATLLSKGDKPYVKEKAYKDLKAFKPSVVVILLGTNDTKPQNWKHADDFADDYKALIKELSALDSKPKICLCTPVPAYPANYGIDDAIIKAEVKPRIEQIGGDAMLRVIDLYTALSGKPELFPDKVHPNADGAAVIAKAVFLGVTGAAD